MSDYTDALDRSSGLIWYTVTTPPITQRETLALGYSLASTLPGRTLVVMLPDSGERMVSVERWTGGEWYELARWLKTGRWS